MILVRIVAPHFVAGLETNGVVRRAAPIMHYMVGWPDDRVRAYVKEPAWKTSVVADPQIIQHEDSFEVRDDNAGRRAVTGRMTREAAFAARASLPRRPVAGWASLFTARLRLGLCRGA
jgi:hypothetical protein